MGPRRVAQTAHRVKRSSRVSSHYAAVVVRQVLILGAGFGGLELAIRLSDSLRDEVQVTLVDQNDSFIFGFSKLEILFGRRTRDELRCSYRDISKPGVAYRQERVMAIDPTTRQVVTDGNSYQPDILVVALGADYDLTATPGFEAEGYEYYSVAGAERLRNYPSGRRRRAARAGPRDGRAAACRPIPAM